MTNSENHLSPVERRLERELTQVAALGRGGVRVAPGAGPQAVMGALRESADLFGFASPIDAATHVMRRLDELPAAERENPIPAYHASASETVRTGRVVSKEVTDGALTLVFERETALTPLVEVTLATRVRLKADGEAHLADHGWPAPPSRPVHTFIGTPEELLDRAQAGLAAPEVPLDQSLLLLWGARIGSADLVGTQEQRLLVAEGAAVRGGEIRSFLSRTEQLATGPAEEWYAACLHRSLLENLFEGFLGTVTFSLVEPEDIDDVDEELRKSLPQAEGALLDAVPPGVPDEHWWWRAPFTRP